MSTQISLSELTQRAKAALLEHTKQDTPATNALAAAIAAVSYGNYSYQDQLFKEFHPETCSEAWLYVHASRLSTPRLLPTLAKGFVQFKATAGAVLIPKATKIKAQQGQEYETTAQAYSNQPIAVSALEAGDSSNLAADEKLTLTQAISGIEINLTSLGIEGGSELEDVEHWRTRVILAYNNKTAIGRLEDYTQWALSAHGSIDFAWGLDNTPQRGMIEIYVGTRNTNPSVSNEVLNYVQEKLEQNRLAGCHPIAKRPTAAPLNIEIQGITDQNIQTAVRQALDTLIKNKMGVVDSKTHIPAPITPTEIVLTISSVTPGFIVKRPANEVRIAAHQIHTLGTITWTA